MYAAEHHAARLSSPEILLGNWRRTAAMPRLLLLTGVILPMANYAFAQGSPDPTPMQCQLIRSAVAQYGFAAARQHALETYGPEAVKTGDKCFTKQEGRDTSSYAPTETEPPGGTALEIACVYFEDEARRIATNVAKLTLMAATATSN